MSHRRSEPGQSPRRVLQRLLPRDARWVTLLVFILLAILWGGVGIPYRQSLIANEKANLLSQVESIENQISSNVNRRQAILVGLAASVKAHPEPNFDDSHFLNFAAGLFADDPIIRAIQYFPPEGPELVYPLVGNEAVAGRSLELLKNSENPEVREDVRRALESGEITVSDPYELRQGGQGVVARMAVYDHERFSGIVAVVLNLKPLLAVSGFEQLPADKAYALRDRKGRVFWGEEEVFQSDPVTSDITLPDGIWTLGAAPRAGWNAGVIWRMVGFAGLGLLLAVTLSAIVYLTYSRQDVLQRMVIERTKKLTESEERYATALRVVNEGIWEWDFRQQTGYVSEHCKDIFGFPQTTFDSLDSWLGYIHANDRAETALIIQRGIENGSGFSLEARIQKPNGIWIDVMNVAQVVETDPEGKALRIVGTIQDITQRKIVEEQLRESEAKFRALFDNSIASMMLIVPSGGQIVDVNPAACSFYGWSRGELLNKNIMEICLDNREEIQVEFANAEREQRKFFKLRHKLASGEVRHVEIYGGAIQHRGQRLMFSIIHDVTSRRQAENDFQRLLEEAEQARHVLLSVVEDQKIAEEKLNLLNSELERRVKDRTAQLEAANKELEAFSYSVSHDLRAPLRGIDGWSQALLEDYGDQMNDKGRLYLSRVRAETLHMGHLIDDLLQLSRVARQEIRRDTFNLSQLVEKVATRLQDEIPPERKIRWIIQPAVMAFGDISLLEISITNLLANAVKFSGKKDEAVIEFGRCAREGADAYFVRDNGAGFDMAYAQNLFSAFQRMHKQSEFPGTGIGLATVQRIVSRHGGKVWAESAKNEGAAFFFTLGETA